MTGLVKTLDNYEWNSLKFVEQIFDLYDLSSPANHVSEAAIGGVLWKKCS